MGREGMMKKLTAVAAMIFLVLHLGGGAYAQPAQSSEGETPSTGQEVPLPLDGTWVVKDQFFACCPGYFPDTFIFTSADPVLLRVTDLFVIGDAYNVYDNGTFLFSATGSGDWSELGFSDPFQPPYADDPEWVWSQRAIDFSKGYRLLPPGTHRIRIQAVDRPTGFEDSTVAISVRPVPRLDVKPGEFPNVVNPGARGILPVALLGSPHVDVKNVDTNFPLHLGGASPIRQFHQDVNGDGYQDLVLHYRLEETGIKPGDTSVSFLGKMKGYHAMADLFVVTDSIQTVPGKKSGGSQISGRRNLGEVRLPSLGLVP